MWSPFSTLKSIYFWLLNITFSKGILSDFISNFDEWGVTKTSISTQEQKIFFAQFCKNLPQARKFCLNWNILGVLGDKKLKYTPLISEKGGDLVKEIRTVFLSRRNKNSMFNCLIIFLWLVFVLQVGAQAASSPPAGLPPAYSIGHSDLGGGGNQGGGDGGLGGGGGMESVGIEYGFTPLHLAAESGWENLVRLLLNSPGVQPDVHTSLHVSIKAKARFELL